MANLNDRYIRHFLTTELSRLGGAKVSRLLDVGCGDMRYASLYESAAERVVSLDVEVRSPAVSVIGSAAQLPFHDGTFDVVVCCEVVEHVEKQRDVLQSIARVLKPGGLLLLTFPFLHGLHEVPNDYGRPTEFALAVWAHETRLNCESFVRRGGALAVIYTITTEFMQAAITAICRWSKVFAPVGVVANFLFSCAHAVAFKTSLATGGRRQVNIGSGLTGVSGQLAHWPLGYCFVLRKATVEPDR